MGQTIVSLNSRISPVMAHLSAELVTAVADTADMLVDLIGPNIPMESGELAYGLQIQYGDGGLSAEVGIFDPELDYAEYPEYGTSSQLAQPFMRPGAALIEQPFINAAADAVHKALA